MSVPKRPGNVVDGVVETLRERIVSGQIPPGVRISQQQLAEELQVSRTPLREAMQRLATEGLLVGEANRGMVVAPVQLSDVEDAYALRLLVEPPTVAAITDSVTADDLDAMAEALADMEEPTIGTKAFQDAHFRYHAVLLDRYPPYADELIHQLHRTIYRQQRLYFSRPPAVADFLWLDRAFLEALQARKGELARHILEFHLLDAALGLVLDIDPDFAFESLAVTLRGLGIAVPDLGRTPVRLPLSLTWTREVSEDLPALLKTSNLEHSATAD
ncbi:GntR family transcriptional regulator [Nocardioides sp. AN3]